MKKNTNTELQVLEVEADEIPLEDEIQGSLIKNNITEKVFAELEKKYGKIQKLKNLDDKETFLMLKEDRKNIRVVGIAVEKICKKGREKANAIQKAWLKKEKDLLERLDKLIDPRDAEIKKFEDEQERKEIEERERRENEFIERQSMLLKYGAKYDNGSYVSGEISYESNSIKESDADVFNEIILPKYKNVFDRVQAELVAEENKKAEEARVLKEQQEKLRAEQEALENQKREFAEAQAEMKKMKEAIENEKKAKELQEYEEAQKKVREKVSQRCTQLTTLGLKYSPQHDSYVFEDVAVSRVVEIEGLDDASWDKMVAGVIPVIERNKKEAEEKRIAEEEMRNKLMRQREAGKARFETLVGMGITNEDETNLGCMSYDDWGVMFSAYKKAYDKKKNDEWLEEQKIKEQRRVEELAAAADKDKWAYLLLSLKQVSIPEMKSPSYRKKVQILKEKIEEIESL